MFSLELGQLDVAIKEHKLEMEKKVEYLQEALEKSQNELREKDQQVSHWEWTLKGLLMDIKWTDEVPLPSGQMQFLTERMEMLKSQLQDKEDIERVWHKHMLELF